MECRTGGFRVPSGRDQADQSPPVASLVVELVTVSPAVCDPAVGYSPLEQVGGYWGAGLGGLGDSGFPLHMALLTPTRLRLKSPYQPRPSP